MESINTSRFILHVSDFHLINDENELEFSSKALKSLTRKLKDERIKIDYLVCTGDIIDASDLYDKAGAELSSVISADYYEIPKGQNEKEQKIFKFDEFKFKATNDEKKRFDDAVKNLAKIRFKAAEKIMQEFISDLNISFGNVVICSGNHDVLRLLSIDENSIRCTERENDEYCYSESNTEIFEPFEDFLDNLGVANSKKRNGREKSVSLCTLDNMNFLILNTNWLNPYNQKAGYYCVHCEQVKKTITDFISNKEDSNSLNMILAHKPIYEICEKARLSYKRYIKTPFMSKLQKFIDTRGVYFCGDKHTRSIIGSFFHDIPHYIGGEPLRLSVSKDSNAEVEYNLLEVVNKEIGMERKIHLECNHTDKNWICSIRPQDKVVSKLYKLSKQYIIKNSFELMAGNKAFQTWESLCQETYTWEKDRKEEWSKYINNLHRSICKYRKNGEEETPLDNEEVFPFVLKQIESQMNNYSSKNVLNIRGEYSSGKSTFLGLFYIFLLSQYSIGKINFIPAYFNLENKDMFKKIEEEGSYYDAVKKAFGNYTKEVQEIAEKERQPICYIIDGLDEQDCWSFSTEDSVGRVVLDVLSIYDQAYHIMSFSQHRLPHFKNTMPIRVYNDTSDIMYFNPIDVRESGAEDTRFVSFVEAFLMLKIFPFDSKVKSETKTLLGDMSIDEVCRIIRNFRRLTITPGFMNQNFDFITLTDDENQRWVNSELSVKDIYRYYIDRQNEICLNSLEYGFVKYAPAMAYLFAYKGFTYEKFKRLRNESILNQRHVVDPICQNYDKIYHTFLFIKKHNDAREYLIALHYNRELRYYAEHPTEEIAEESILNEFITRNIAVLIRKLWKDTNKFIIVCEHLLEREDLSNCLQSMMIYCLAHLEIYPPIRDRLRTKMIQKAEDTLQKQKLLGDITKDELWKIYGNDSFEKLEHFIKLSLKHSIEIFKLINDSNRIERLNRLVGWRGFQEYNQQFQMLYYGDLSIQGENKRNLLIPGRDVVYKGFDFHNCFNYLYVKLSSKEQYPLREFDMYTISTLFEMRLQKDYLNQHVEKGTFEDTFFYREISKKKADMILKQVKGIFDVYFSKTEKDSLKGDPKGSLEDKPEGSLEDKSEGSPEDKPEDNSENKIYKSFDSFHRYLNKWVISS